MLRFAKAMLATGWGRLGVVAWGAWLAGAWWTVDPGGDWSWSGPEYLRFLLIGMLAPPAAVALGMWVRAGFSARRLTPQGLNGARFTSKRSPKDTLAMDSSAGRGGRQRRWASARAFIRKTTRTLAGVLFPWGVVVAVLGCVVLPKDSTPWLACWYSFLAFLGLAVLLGLVRVLVLTLRIVVSAVGLGNAACRRGCRGWHWWTDFPVHTAVGYGSKTISYLAVQGIRIERCVTCRLVYPTSGRELLAQYEAGQIKVKARWRLLTGT